MMQVNFTANKLSLRPPYNRELNLRPPYNVNFTSLKGSANNPQGDVFVRTTTVDKK